MTSEPNRWFHKEQGVVDMVGADVGVNVSVIWDNRLHESYTRPVPTVLREGGGGDASPYSMPVILPAPDHGSS